MIIQNGKTDVTTYFVLRDSTNHAPKTDVTITDIDLYYVEELAAISAKADATALAAADSAHGDNQAYHVGQGLYRIDWPDAAFDGGIGKKVQLIVVCTGVDTTFLEVELSPAVNVKAISDDETAADNLESACDNYSATRGLSGTALPAAAADAAGGLPISDAGGLDIDAKLANTNEVTAARLSELDAGTVGKMANQVDIIQTDTTTDIPGTITSMQGNITTILAAVDTEITAIQARLESHLSGATMPELSQGIPTATPTLEQAVMLIYMKLRNKLTTTATELAVYNDAGTKITKAALSDDGTTFEKAELISGV